MTVSEILEVFKLKPYMIDMGAGLLSKRLKTTVDNIKSAKHEFKKSQNYNKNKTNLPKILIFDIETSPLRAYVWSRWKQNVYLEQTISEWFMISWAAKWLHSDTVMSNSLTSSEIISENDSRIVTSLWALIDEADIVVAHNGGRFDLPKINSRFILNKLAPPRPVHMIDTKVISAKQFGFSSNKLDALATYFGFECKMDTDFELWSKCMDGDETSLRYMEEYNRYDVVLLEKIYLRLRPWIKNHVNVGIYVESDDHVCGNCGSSDLSFIDEYRTNTGKYFMYRCKCGAISRTRKSHYDKGKNLLTTNIR